MNSIIVSPHDKIVRAALGNVNVAREYFESNLPREILSVINLGILKLCPTRHVNKQLKDSESDIVYETALAGSEERCYLRIAHEHQSTDPVFMPLRMLAYDIELWQEHRAQHPASKPISKTCWMRRKK